MSTHNEATRRKFLMKIGIVLNGAVATLLGVPIIKYLLSPVAGSKKGDYEEWISLGELEQFPAGETRLAKFRNPIVNSWDGATAEIPCWVRNIDDSKFQVFAINCAHLGCPVRWFPQSGLFMCPCHGGAYYQDGSRASGPPERGLFEYSYRVKDGKLFIQSRELPTPGIRASNLVKEIQPCA
jgi:menaquinol-cytochrome c reductase iron-sulfur subunit